MPLPTSIFNLKNSNISHQRSKSRLDPSLCQFLADVFCDFFNCKKKSGNVGLSIPLIMEDGRSDFKILTSKPTRKIPIGRPRRRWEDNIRMDLIDICLYEKLGCSAQNRNYWRAL